MVEEKKESGHKVTFGQIIDALESDSRLREQVIRYLTHEGHITSQKKDLISSGQLLREIIGILGGKKKEEEKGGKS